MLTQTTPRTRVEQMQLAHLAATGDTTAFETLYRDYDRRIRGAVSRIVQPDDVDDVAQNAWMKITRALATWKGDAAFSTWAHSIASNAALDFLRRTENDRVTESLEMTVRGSDGAEVRVHEPAIEERSYETVGDIDKLRAAIADLPPSLQLIMAFRNEGCSNAEIADNLDMTVQGVKSAIHRITDRLRQAMGVTVTAVARRRRTPPSPNVSDQDDAHLN